MAVLFWRWSQVSRRRSAALERTALSVARRHSGRWRAGRVGGRGQSRRRSADRSARRLLRAGRGGVPSRRRRAAPASRRRANPRTGVRGLPGFVHPQGMPVCAAIGCVSPQRLIQRCRWGAAPPLPGCQALLGHAGAEPPHTPPLGSAARKVEGLFPARPSESSRAAEPLKAKPCGWRAQGARASLDRTCRAPPRGACLAGKTPQAQASQAPAGRIGGAPAGRGVAPCRRLGGTVPRAHPRA
jgi:hypothetical protein